MKMKVIIQRNLPSPFLYMMMMLGPFGSAFLHSNQSGRFLESIILHLLNLDSKKNIG